jgi:hypothetical protein
MLKEFTMALSAPPLSRLVRTQIWTSLAVCAFCHAPSAVVRVSIHDHGTTLVPVCSAHSDMRVDVYSVDILRTIEGN